MTSAFCFLFQKGISTNCIGKTVLPDSFADDSPTQTGVMTVMAMKVIKFSYILIYMTAKSLKVP